MPRIVPKLAEQSIDYRDFGGGYNSRDTDINVADNELTGGQNVDISPDQALAKRKGHTLHGNFIGSTTGILGLFSHEPAGGTAEQLAVYNTNIYRNVAGVWTALTGGATLTTNLKADAAHFPINSKTYITNGTDNVQVYTSGATIASDASFKKGKYIAHYKNRLLVANVTGDEDRVWYTDLGVDTFGTENYFSVEGEVTGLEVLFDKLLVFAKRKVYVLQSFSFDGVLAGPEAVIPLKTDFGAIIDRTITKVGNVVYFLGQDSEGVASIYVTDGYNIQIVSDKISPDLNDLAPGSLTNACAAPWGRFYRLSVTPTGETKNTKEYLFDTVSRRWLPPYTNTLGGFSCYATFETSGELDLYAGSQTYGYVYKLNQADYDEETGAIFIDAGSTDVAIDANPAKRAAQSFKLTDYSSSTSVPINTVFVMLKKNAGTTTDLQVRIETDNNGKPSGTLVTNGSATIAAFTSTSYAYKQADFTSCEISGNTSYWIVVKHATEGSGDSQYYWLGDSSSPTYTDGASATYAGGVTSSTDTFNPDANPESTSVDGVVFRAVHDAPESFSTLRTTTTGSKNDSSVSASVNLISSATSNLYGEMARLIFLFDTSSLPNDAAIVNATLSLYVQATGDAFNQSVGVTSASPDSNTALVNGDYDIGDFGSTRFASDVALTSLTANAYNNFALNASGKSAISLTGITKFALRLSGDIDNSAPTWTSLGESYATIQTADSSNKPRLTVEYTTVSGTAVWTSVAGTDQNFVVFNQGAIDGYGDTKAFYISPQGQRAHLREMFVTADAPGDHFLQVGISGGTFNNFATANVNLGTGNPLWGSTFILGSSQLGGRNRTEERLTFNSSRVRTAKFRFRNQNANEPFITYGFRTRFEVDPKLR